MSKLAALLKQHRAIIHCVSAVRSGNPVNPAFQCNAKCRDSTGYTVCFNDDPETGMIEALERSVRTLAVCGGVSGLKNQSKPIAKPKPPPIVFDDDDLLGEDEEEDLLG